MKDKEILCTLNNGFKVIEYIDEHNNKLRALASPTAIYSDTMTGSNKYELYYPYIRLYDLPNKLNKNIKNTLVLGAGCLTYPKYYISHYLDKNLDAVEIDSEIIDVAYKYFYVDDLYKEYDSNKKRLNIYTEDANNYVKNCNKKYDYIFNDIFNDSEPDDSFLSYDFINTTKRILNHNGIFSTNYIINKGSELKFDNYISRLKNYYNYIYIISVNDEKVFKNGLGNVYIIASDYEYLIPDNDKIILLNYLLLK